MTEAIKAFFGGLLSFSFIYICMDAIMGHFHVPLWTWFLSLLLTIGIYICVGRRFIHNSGGFIGGICVSAMAWLLVVLLGDMSFATG